MWLEAIMFMIITVWTPFNDETLLVHNAGRYYSEHEKYVVEGEHIVGLIPNAWHHLTVY